MRAFPFSGWIIAFTLGMIIRLAVKFGKDKWVSKIFQTQGIWKDFRDFLGVLQFSS